MVGRTNGPSTRPEGESGRCSFSRLQYGWGTDVGLIEFAPTGGGVTIDPQTGAFTGYAWGGEPKLDQPQGGQRGHDP